MDPLAPWKVVLVVLLTVGSTRVALDWSRGDLAVVGGASADTAAPTRDPGPAPDVDLPYPSHIAPETMPRATEYRLLKNLEAAEAGYDGALPLVVVIGDSRFRSAFVDTRDDTPSGFHPRMELGGATVSALIVTEAASRQFRRVHGDIMERILALRPARFVTQPTVFRPNARYLLAGKQRLHKRGQGGPKGRIEAQWGSEALPVPGEDLEVGAYWAQQARRQGTAIVVIELPPSASVRALAPEGYFAAREALIAPLLRGAGDGYHRLVAELPDDHYTDFRHFNDVGRARVRPWMERVVAGTL